MSANRQRTPFGMHHLTVVPRNADVDLDGGDEREESLERDDSRASR